MADAWIDVTESLVTELLAEQHPDLAHLELRPANPGHDNAVWQLGDDLAVRLPRRAISALLTEKEIEWVPRLFGRLPLPVPAVVRIGDPTDRYPLPWYVARWVPGESSDRLGIPNGRRSALALAEFLRALHLPAPADAPVNPERGREMRPGTVRLEHLLIALGADIDSAAIRAVWTDGCDAPAHDGPAVWLHADLHPANVAVVDGTIAGIIDFGDLCCGDPAYDLASAWLLLPDDSRPTFSDAYGLDDEATARRARGWAGLIALNLLLVGVAGERGEPGGKTTWADPARAALARVAADVR